MDLNEVIRDHPAAVLAVLGFLISLVSTLMLVPFVMLKGRIDSQGKKVDEFGEKLGRLEGDVVSLQESTAKTARQEDDWFESMTVKVDGLIARVSQISEENIEAHSNIIEGRMNIVERVAALEAKMPNGEKIIALMAELVRQKGQ